MECISLLISITGLNMKRVRVLTPLFAVMVFLLLTVCIQYSPPSHKNIMTDEQSGRHISTKHQVILWTMMRSGSRMTQDMLQALSCTFPTEEPLRMHRHKRPEFLTQLMKDIFQCRFFERPDFFVQWVNGTSLNHENLRLRLCKDLPRLCSDARLTVALCHTACVQLVRVAAVELRLAAALLQDPALSVRIVHLVRDPRALMASREALHSIGNGFEFDDDEINSTTICDRYTRDLASARFLTQRFPSRYTLLRYEDLGLHPEREVQRLYKFLDIPYTSQVANRVTTHTLGFMKSEFWLTHPYSTFKNSSATVFAWRGRLDFSEVKRLQQECGAVLKAYGYRTFPTPHHYHDPHNSPLLPLPPLL